MTVEQFPPACGKPTAHGPHPYGKKGKKTCPGLKAHPNTMIGGGGRRESR